MTPTAVSVVALCVALFALAGAVVARGRAKEAALAAFYLGRTELRVETPDGHVILQGTLVELVKASYVAIGDPFAAEQATVADVELADRMRLHVSGDDGPIRFYIGGRRVL